MSAPIDLDALPLILYDADLCGVLGVSRTTLRKLRRHGAFPIPELPALDKRKRYGRPDVERYINRENLATLSRRRA